MAYGSKLAPSWHSEEFEAVVAGARGSNIASASTITIPATGGISHVTGAVTIAYVTISPLYDGQPFRLYFESSLTLTHNAGSPSVGTVALSLVGATNYVVPAGTLLAFWYDATLARVVEYGRSVATGGGDLLSTNNLSDVASPSAARSNLGLVIGTNVQAFDAELAALAGLTSAADRLPYFTGSGTAALATFTSAGRALIDDADAATQRTTLGLAIGTDVQAFDPELSALVGLTSAADKAPYFTGSGTAATTDLTSTARSLLDDTSTSAMRTTLGLAIGTDVQAFDAELAALASTTSAANKLPYFTGSGTATTADLSAQGRALIDDADASAMRTTLGVVIGTDVQAQDAELAALAGLTSAADKLPYFTGSGTAAVTDFTSTARSLLDDGSTSAMRTTLGLAIGSDVQAFDAELTALAGLVSAADRLPYFTGSGTASLATFTTAGRALVDDADAAAQRTTLGLGTIATQAADNVAITGGTITGLGTPSAASDVAIKSYVDSIAAGAQFKAVVRVATTAAGTLASSFENGDSVDGVTLATNDRILIKNQAAQTENGIYVVAASGAPARSADADTGAELVKAAVQITAGTVNAGLFYICDQTAITLGVTNITFSNYASAIGALVAANNLSDLTNASTARTNLGVAIGSNVQAFDAELAALAGLTSAADKLPYFTGSGTAATADFTATARTLLDDSSTGAMRTTLGLAIGTDVQAFDAELSALAGLTSAADKLPYFTGSGTASVADFTAAGRALVDDANASAQRTTLGLAIGTDVQAQDAELSALAGLTSAADKLPYFTGSGTASLADFTSTARSLLDDASTSAMRTTLGLVIGTDVQAQDAELAALAGLTSAADKIPYFTGAGTAAVADFTSTARSLVDDTSTSAMRTTLGLVIGTDVQAQDAELAAIAGLASAADRLPYFTGSGTAALATFTAAGRALIDDADAATQRTTLGLVIGTDVQAFDAELAALASVTSAADALPYFTGSGAASTTTLSAFIRTLLDDGSSSTARATLGLTIGTDVQAQDAELSALAGLVSAADRLPYFTGSGTASLANFTAAGRAIIDDADAPAQRTTLGLGTMATQDASSVNIVGGAISGISDLAIADGGTSASTAVAAAKNLDTKGSDIAAAATVDLATATGTYVDVTGSGGPITSFGTVTAGNRFVVRFTGTPTITHNGTSLIVPGAASIVAAAGDIAVLMSLGSGNWFVADYVRAAAIPWAATQFSSSVAGIVPASGGGSSNFMRADGTWASPPGTGEILLTKKVPTANFVITAGYSAHVVSRFEVGASVQVECGAGATLEIG